MYTYTILWFCSELAVLGTFSTAARWDHVLKKNLFMQSVSNWVAAFYLSVGLRITFLKFATFYNNMFLKLYCNILFKNGFRWDYTDLWRKALTIWSIVTPILYSSGTIYQKLYLYTCL